MSRARTLCSRIEERTLSIGFGIKRASEREIGLPELLALQPALNRCEPIPLGPLTAHQFFGLNHAKAIAGSRLGVKLFCELDESFNLLIETVRPPIQNHRKQNKRK